MNDDRLHATLEGNPMATFFVDRLAYEEAHTQKYNPQDTRALAEIRAKRVIVYDYLRAMRLAAREEANKDSTEFTEGFAKATAMAYESVVRNLIEVWDGHKDYDPDWSF